MPTLFGKSEAARMLNCSITTIDRLRASGKLASLKIGDTVKFRESDVLDYINHEVSKAQEKDKIPA